MKSTLYLSIISRMLICILVPLFGYRLRINLQLFSFLHHSKLLGCKQKIIDLLPKIEVALNNIKEADNSVMQMQGKRQREIWHLLKIACVSLISASFCNWTFNYKHTYLKCCAELGETGTWWTWNFLFTEVSSLISKRTGSGILIFINQQTKTNATFREWLNLR